MKPFLLYALTFANALGMLHLGFFMVGANVYDIKQMRRASKQKAVKQRRYRPLISVIVPAHNEELGVLRTLNSILASSYRKIEIIVVDDGSKDTTARIVKDFIRAHGEPLTECSISRCHKHGSLHTHSQYGHLGKRQLRLVRQANKGKAGAMNNAIKNFAQGELIMSLDADSMIDKRAIEHAVRYFEEADVMGIAANVRVMGRNNWLALLQRYEHMIGYRSKKFYTLTKSEFIIGGVASTYRTELVKKVGLYDTDTQTEDIGLSMKLIANEGNRHSRILYAADVVAMTEGVQTFGALLKQRYRWKLGALQNMFKFRALILSQDDEKYTRRLTVYRLPMALLSELMLLVGPIMLCFIVYLSFMRHTPNILVGAYVTATIYTLWTVWPDEYLTNRQKIRMSVYGFGMYVLFYAMDVVQFSAICRCVWNYKKVIMREVTKSTWVSPARVGGKPQTV